MKKYLVNGLVCFLIISTVFSQSINADITTIDNSDRVDLKENNYEKCLEMNHITIKVAGSLICKLEGWSREYSGYIEFVNLGPDVAYIKHRYIFKRVLTNKILLDSGRWSPWWLSPGQGVLIPILDWFYGIGFCELLIEIVGFDEDSGLHIVHKSFGVCNNRNIYFFMST